MTWRTRVLVQQPPTAAVVFTLMTQPNLYAGIVLANGDVVHTENSGNANAADGAAMAWVQNLGIAQGGPREVSRVRCGRNDQDALLLYHFRDVVVLTLAQVTGLSQAPPAAVLNAIDVLNQGLNAGYQAIVAEWLADQTLGWGAVVNDAAHVLGVAGVYLPSNF